MEDTYMQRASDCLNSIVNELRQIWTTTDATQYIESCLDITVADDPLSPGRDLVITYGGPTVVLDIGTGKLRYHENGEKTVSTYIPEKVRKLLFESQYPY